MITLIHRISDPSHVSLFDDRISVVEKEGEKIEFRRINFSDKDTIEKSDCVLVTFRGISNEMDLKAVKIACEKNLKGIWVITPNGLHQNEGRKFVHWGSEGDKQYYGQGDKNGVYHNSIFSLWEHSIHNATKNLFEYFDVAFEWRHNSASGHYYVKL